jgi:hypothetical protein
MTKILSEKFYHQAGEQVDRKLENMQSVIFRLACVGSSKKNIDSDKTKSITAWAAYRDGRLLFESMRGTRAEVVLYLNVLFGLNKLYTVKSLGIEISKITIKKGGT